MLSPDSSRKGPRRKAVKSNPYSKTELTKQSDRYNRVMTTMLNSLSHAADTLQRAEYVVNSTSDNIDKRSKERESRPRMVSALAVDGAQVPDAPSPDGAQHDAGRPMISAAEFASPEEQEAVEMRLMEEMTAEAGLSVFSALAARPAAGGRALAVGVVGDDALVAGSSHPSPRSPELSEPVELTSRASQTTQKFSEDDETSFALERVSASLNAASDTIARMESFVYGLAGKVLAEHNALVSWARRAHLRCQEVLSDSGADSAPTLPALPDFISVSPEERSSEAVMQQELRMRTMMSTRVERTAMEACDFDAALVPKTRFEQVTQTEPAVRDMTCQTAPVGDGLANSVRSQHDRIEAVVTAIRHSSNKMWGWECRPFAKSTFYTHAELEEMVKHDTSQLEYLLDSVKGAPLAVDAALKTGSRDRAVGADVALGEVADATSATDPVKILDMTSYRVSAVQAVPATATTGSYACADSDEIATSARSITTPVAMHFADAVRERHPTWTLGAQTVQHVAEDGSSSGDDGSDDDAPREASLPASVARQLTDEAVARVKHDTFDEMESLTRQTLSATEAFFFQRLRAVETTERAAIDTSQSSAAQQEQRRTLETQLRDTQSALAIRTREYDSISAILSKIGVEGDESVEGLDFRVYRRMVAELEQREQELRDELVIERGRSIQAGLERATVRSVGINVAAKTDDAGCSARPLMVNRIDQTDAIPDPEPVIIERPYPTEFVRVQTTLSIPPDETAGNDIAVARSSRHVASAVETCDVALTASVDARDFGALAKPFAFDNSVQAQPVMVDVAAENIPPPRGDAADSETQVWLRHSDASCMTEVAVRSAEAQVDTVAPAKFVLPPADAIEVHDEALQASPEVHDSMTAMSTESQVRDCHVQTLSASQRDRLCGTDIVTAEFSQMWGKPPAVLCDAECATQAQVSTVACQAVCGIATRTRATWTSEDGVDDGVADQPRSDEHADFESDSITIGSVRLPFRATNEAAVDVIDALAHNFSVLGRRGRTMSVMFQSMRERILREDAEDAEAASDDATSDVVADSDTVTAPNPAGAVPAPTSAGELSLASSTSLREAVSSPMEAPRAEAGAQTDSLEREVMSRGVSPVASLYGSEKIVAADVTRPTPVVAVQTVQTVAVVTSSRATSPLLFASDSVDVATQIDADSANVQPLRPAFSDLASRDIPSAYSHTRGTTAGSSHVFGLTGTRPNSVSGPQFDGSIPAAVGEAVIEALREQLSDADAGEPHDGAERDHDAHAPAGTEVAPDDETQVRQAATLMLDWRRQGAITMPGSHPRRRATHHHAETPTSLAFGRHDTSLHKSPRSHSVDLSVGEAESPTAKLGPVQAVVTAHTPPPKHASKRTGPARHLARRPQQANMSDQALVHGGWAQASRTPSSFGADQLPRRVDAGAVKVNSIAFDVAATDGSMQHSSSHVLPSLGVALPAHRRPQRLAPLSPTVLSDAPPPMYTPTDDTCEQP